MKTLLSTVFFMFACTLGVNSAFASTNSQDVAALQQISHHISFSNEETAILKGGQIKAGCGRC